MVNRIKCITVEIDSVVGGVTAVATLIEDEPSDELWASFVMSISHCLKRPKLAVIRD